MSFSVILMTFAQVCLAHELFIHELLFMSFCDLFLCAQMSHTASHWFGCACIILCIGSP